MKTRKLLVPEFHQLEIRRTKKYNDLLKEIYSSPNIHVLVYHLIELFNLDALFEEEYVAEYDSKTGQPKKKKWKKMKNSRWDGIIGIRNQNFESEEDKLEFYYYDKILWELVFYISGEWIPQNNNLDDTREEDLSQDFEYCFKTKQYTAIFEYDGKHYAISYNEEEDHFKFCPAAFHKVSKSVLAKNIKQ